MARMDGRHAIVTGGNSGIGEATAKLLAKEGACVSILARREDEGQRVVDEIATAGGQSAFFQCNVMSRESVREAVQAAIAKFGNVTALFNNAGAGFPDTFPDMEDANFEKDLSLNLTSVYRVASEAWQSMIDAGGGSVVNMSSTAAVVAPSQSQRAAMPALPSPGYAAGKAGVEGLSRYMASVGSPNNIRVNGIRPGQIVTPLTTRYTPGHHIFEGFFEQTQLTAGPGTSEDVANLVVFLLSEDSRFINGQIIDIDGGTAGKV
jgi:NAD(P)-dependent dehydrogenase (short-subunit alcohol dehydrogenase family)